MQKRQNSGYTSVGHLLHKGQENEVFKDVVKSLCANELHKELIQGESAMWKWDQFSKTAKLHLNTFASFLDGMLRKSETDPLLLQIKVELLIWKKMNFQAENLMKKTKAYKLFCIFNRFCQVDDLPLEMGPKEVTFLFHTLDHKRDSNIPKFLKFEGFLQAFEDVDPDTLDKFYDEFILDLVISGEVRAKIYHKK